MCNWTKFVVVVTFVLSNVFQTATADARYNPTGDTNINLGSIGSQAQPILVLDAFQGAEDTGRGSGPSRVHLTPGFDASLGVGNQINGAKFGPSGPLPVGVNVGKFSQAAIIGDNVGRHDLFANVDHSGLGARGSGLAFGQAAAIGGIPAPGVRYVQVDNSGLGLGRPGVPIGQVDNNVLGATGPVVGFGQAAAIGLGVGRPGVGIGQAAAIGLGVGSSGFGIGQPGVGGIRGQGVRVIEAPITPTVTKTITIDNYKTVTDLAYNSVPVTLTDLIVRTTTATTRQVIQTPVNDRVALQTSVFVSPTTLSVTCTKYDYRIVTDVSVAHVTITHSFYRIQQITYTTTVTQAVTYPSTMVRTIVQTQRTTLTDYRTIAHTVHGGYEDYY